MNGVPVSPMTPCIALHSQLRIGENFFFNIVLFLALKKYVIVLTELLMALVVVFKLRQV